MSIEPLPDWMVSIPSNPAIHNPPARRGGPMENPLTWQQLQVTFERILDAFIAQIAIAFGGIEIFGWKPFEFLVDWGNDLLNKANNADAGQQQANQKIEDTWNQFWATIFGEPTETTTDKGLDDFIDAVLSWFGLTNNAVEQAQTAVNLFNFGAAQSIWGAANPTMVTSLNLGDLRKPAVSGSTVTTANDPWSTDCVQSSSSGAFVRFEQSKDLTVAQFIAKRVGTITTCKFHVWRLNTNTGDVTYLQTVAINPVTLPAIDFDFVNPVLGAAVHVEPGTQLVGEAAITGSGTLVMAGIDMPYAKDDLTARPKRKGWARNTGTETAPPATIADAAVPYSSEVPYIGFGVLLSDLPTPKFFYSDGFSSGTTQWTALAGSLNFADGVFKTGGGSHNCALFSSATNSDEARIQFDLRATFNIVFGGFQSGDLIRLIGWANNTLSQYVALEIQSNQSVITPGFDHDIRIVTGTSPTGPVTQRTPGGIGIPGNYNGTLSIEYDPGTNTYGVFVGGETLPTLTWQDTGNVIAHGPDRRRAAIYANLDPVFGLGADQPICDNFVYRDL